MRNATSNFSDEPIKSSHEIAICTTIKTGKNTWLIKILYKYGKKKQEPLVTIIVHTGTL